MKPQPALRPRCERQTCPMLSPSMCKVAECISSPSPEHYHPLYEAHAENLANGRAVESQVQIRHQIEKSARTHDGKPLVRRRGQQQLASMGTPHRRIHGL